MGLVVKGIVFYDREADCIVVPNMTGYYDIVECDYYVRMEELIENYDDDYIEKNRNNFILLNEEKYFYSEITHCQLDHREYIILSDIDKLEFNPIRVLHEDEKVLAYHS